MSELKKDIAKRKASDPKFAEDFDTGYDAFKIGGVLRQAREETGFTQEQLANRLRTKKSAIPSIENHAADIRLSTLDRFATARWTRIYTDTHGFFIFFYPCSSVSYIPLSPSLKYRSIARAALFAAPIASITVAAPVTISPPANTPARLVAPVSSSATMFPQRFTSNPGVVVGTNGLA